MTFPRRPPATVLVIAGFVLGAPRAAEAAGPKLELSSRATRVDDVEPPEAAPPPAETVPPPAEPAPPPAEPAPPPAEPAPPPDDGGGFEIEDETADEDLSDVETVETVAPSEDAPPPETPSEDEGNWSFEVTDLTEDEAALAKELEVEKVEVKGAKGTVVGTLKDSVSGEPLVGAQVEAVGTKFKTKTGLDGSYTLDLPPGTYEVRFRYDTSQPLRVSQVVVEKDKTQTISRDLVPLAGAGETVKVEAEMNRESEGARLLQRKDSAAARDLMSRDEISKSGGGSTSSVARRIVGSTVIGGRFLFIRGLGHRYGNTLFDGARVPSPEPELRTVPLDIFPSGALSAINIQKTFTPDVPGDFVGGSTQLESREVPDELVVELSADLAANTATTGRNYVTNGAFPGPDGIAFGNLPRALPGPIPRDRPVERTLQNEDFQRVYTDEQIEDFGESMYTDTRVRSADRAPPNYGLGATVGWGKDLGHQGSRFGILAAATYKNAHQSDRAQLRMYGLGSSVEGEPEDLATTTTWDGIRSTHSVAWSTVGLVKGRITKNHRLSLLGFYSRDADDETRSLQGSVSSTGLAVPVSSSRLRYVMRSVLLTRLGGEHVFPKAKDLKIDWFGSYAQARRDDPAIREMFFVDSSANPGALVSSPTNGSGRQTFLDLLDHTESGAANLTIPFKQWMQLDSKVKIGAWVEGKQRDFGVRRFIFSSVSGRQIPPGTGNIINDGNIGGGSPQDSDLYFLQELTTPQDSYRADQEIYATYAMLELPFVRWFRIAGGARFEASRIAVQAYDPFAATALGMQEPLPGAGLDDNDVLPALSLIFSPTSKMNVRFSGTRTLARPEFRELAPFQFTDFAGGFTVLGNTALTTTKIWNADVRWEWFPSSSEVVAASVFYKDFDDPIERVGVSSGSTPFASWRNAEKAYNVGVELEARKSLEFIGRSLKNFSAGANFAYIYSRVRLAPPCVEPGDDTDVCTFADELDISTSRSRPLQGQSPFVVNVYLDYDNEKSGTTGRLLYNGFGRRIDSVMSRGIPDIYEEAQHQFDFVFEQKVYKELALSLKVENIANWPARWTMGADRRIVELWWPGATFTVGLDWKY
jgi:outer membrane receptor protein involved in Fe transport